MTSGHCKLCGTFQKYLEEDHIVPRRKFKHGLAVGDPNDPANLQWICHDCHCTKTATEMSKRFENDPVARARNSAAQRKRRTTPETRAKRWSAALRTHARASAAQSNRSAETRAKMGAAIRQGHAFYKDWVGPRPDKRDLHDWLCTLEDAASGVV